MNTKKTLTKLKKKLLKLQNTNIMIPIFELELNVIPLEKASVVH